MCETNVKKMKHKFNHGGENARCKDCSWQIWSETAHEESVLHAVEKKHRVKGGWVIIYEYDGSVENDYSGGPFTFISPKDPKEYCIII